MRYYSTAPKYKGCATTILMSPNGQFKLYPNEKTERTGKVMLLNYPSKELSSNEAKTIQNAIIRELKGLNELEKLRPIPQRRRYMACKEYLTIEETLKRIEENTEQLEYPEATYFKVFAGWYFWIQLTQSQEEYFRIQYQTEMDSNGAEENQ